MQQHDSQVNKCSMCPPWTLTTVFNLGRHWSMALLISYWSRLTQKVRTLSLRSSKPTIRTDRPILVRKLFTNAFSTHPFCWRTSLIDALSSYIKRMFINKLLCHNDVTLFFPIVFPVELGCFHLFYPITNYCKIFARNSHILLRIDYISMCVIHFKCILLLEDIINWHVGGRFFMAHSVQWNGRT